MARLAGRIPATRPPATSTASESMPVENGIWALSGTGMPGERSVSAADSSPTASASPKTPATNVSTKASLMICEMIVRGLAPNARRTPISCVRSRTVTSMMLLMPTIPASRVPRPTIHVRIFSPRNRLLAISTCSLMFQIITAFVSSGDSVWRLLTICFMLSSTRGMGTPS